MTSACVRCGLQVANTGALPVCPRCLLADDAESEPVAPPGLELEAPIGRGGMGQVYRARHVRLDRQVAVKFLPDDTASDPAFEARFEREARALAKLNHPHIVAVHDFGTHQGQSHLVMEWVPGGTLAERLPVAVPDALSIAIQVCEAVQYAHDKGIIHRDIKPQNVLFDEQGRAKLADFGIARLVGSPSETPLTRASVVLGTPAYMAPEARAGAPPDARMDVFAIGVLLQQMITGRLPGTGPVDLPPALTSIVRRATDSDPERRFPTADRLKAALRALQIHHARAESDPDALPADEQSWQRAAALLFAGATSLSLYAFLTSFTPRIIDAGDAIPFVSFGGKPLPDGRVMSQARFETWPTPAAAGAFALALGAYGLLRRHWRQMGLEVALPHRPIPQVAGAVNMAIFLNALFLLRQVLDQTTLRGFASAYIPVLGGVFELLMVYRVWVCVLEARRTGRLLRHEPRLWVAMALALLPPIWGFANLMTGRPL